MAEPTRSGMVAARVLAGSPEFMPHCTHLRRALNERGIADPPADDPRWPVVVVGQGAAGVTGVEQALRAGHRRILWSPPEAPPARLALDAVRAGARDVVCSRDPGALIARLKRWCEVDALLASPLVRDNLVGGSAPWLEAIGDLAEVAAWSDSNVLVTGESGTGKELAARLVHALDRRPHRRELVVVDCTTIQPALSGSEFFGHERGAFTGADRAREGAFALADGGTLFLDEVGELPPTMQAELLRVIQEGAYKPVGGNQWRQARFRLVCATHRDLPAEVAAGRFRQDLYYRLAAWCTRLPALRDRPGDIRVLAEHFLAALRPEVPGFDPIAAELLLRHAWPGNVRELRQVVCRAAVRHVGAGPVTVGALQLRPGATGEVRIEDVVADRLAAGQTLDLIVREVKDAVVHLAVTQEAGNLQRAATRLGVTDRMLQQWRRARTEESTA